MEDQTVILFCGKAGVGKTTSATMASEYAYRKLFIDSDVFSFARGVKKCAQQFFGWDGKKDEHGRHLLQLVGRFGREINLDNWVNYLIKDIEESSDSLCFVDDCRFPNEIEKIKKYFRTYTIRIESPDREILKGTEAYNDPSETSLPSGTDGNYDVIVYNTGSLEDLKESIQGIINTIIDTIGEN